MEMNPYIVYVKLDSQGHITEVNSSAFLPDVTEWVEIDSGYEYKYHHAQKNYFPKKIKTDSGAYCYKLIDGKTIECTAEEIKAQEKTPKPAAPSQLDIIEAQVTYTAMMTDTLLEV